MFTNRNRKIAVLVNGILSVLCIVIGSFTPGWLNIKLADSEVNSNLTVSYGLFYFVVCSDYCEIWLYSKDEVKTEQYNNISSAENNNITHPDFMDSIQIWELQTEASISVILATIGMCILKQLVSHKSRHEKCLAGFCFVGYILSGIVIFVTVSTMVQVNVREASLKHGLPRYVSTYVPYSLVLCAVAGTSTIFTSMLLLFDLADTVSKSAGHQGTVRKYLRRQYRVRGTCDTETLISIPIRPNAFTESSQGSAPT